MYIDNCVNVINRYWNFTIPDFALGEKVIPSVDQCKYLGIIISVKNCDADLKRQMRKYYANANMLSRKFSYCSPDVKCCMFKSYCYCFDVV